MSERVGTCVDRLPDPLPASDSQEGVRVLLGVITCYRAQVEASQQRGPSSPADVALGFLDDLALRLAPLLRSDVWRQGPRPDPLALSEVERDTLLRALMWVSDWIERYRPGRVAEMHAFLEQVQQRGTRVFEEGGA